MKEVFLPILFATILLAASDAPDSPDTRQITNPQTIVSPAEPGGGPVPIGDLFETRATTGGGWAPDGKQVVFSTNASGRYNVWVLGSDGAAPRQLSKSNDRQFDATWSPDGNWIVFDSDQGGAEIYNLYAIRVAGGDAVNISRTPAISEMGSVWSPDGTRLAFTYKPKTASATDIAIMDWKTRKVRNVTQETTKDHIWQGPVWSPDGTAIYASRSNSSFSDSDAFRIAVDTGSKENLTAHSGQRRTTVSSVSPDGRTLLVTSDRPGGYPNVALLDVATKELTWVTDTKWEASSGDISPDSKQFTYTINADGRSDLYVADFTTRLGSKIAFPAGLNFYAGSPSAFAPQGDRLLVNHESSTQPADLWAYSLSRAQAQQLTFSMAPSLAGEKIPASTLVHYRSFDGKMISAFLWMPYNLKRDASNPAIVLPHGGPTGQTQDYFNREVIALVSRGYVCIAPNVRGSTGYGMAFQTANVKDLGGGDLQDEVYAVKFLEATGYVSPKKVGITGGSYGGYMTLMAIGKTPNLWAAAVEEYGIINWLTMIEHEDPFLQQYERGLLGDPVKDRSIYLADSPLTYIRNEKAPLLVLQGDNDIRVPKEEAEQVVRIVRADGGTIEAHYYANEGHGFEKREDQIDALRRTVDWFDRYLKPSVAGTTP